MKKYFFYTIINFLFVQNLAVAQTQEDFTNKFSEVYLNQSDSVKARAVALEAYDMLESTEELQTIGNYSMLVAIFRDQVKDKELEEICQQKVNAQIDFSSSQVQKPTTYDTPEIEWVYEYQLPFYQKPDSKLGNKALKFLDANPEIKIILTTQQ